MKRGNLPLSFLKTSKFNGLFMHLCILESLELKLLCCIQWCDNSSYHDMLCSKINCILFSMFGKSS